MFKRSSLFAGVAILLSFTLHAQLDRGEISGFVKDPSSASISAASVTIRHEATGIGARIDTNERGFYQATNLVSGYYTVEVEAAGFKKYSEQHVKLDAASTASVNVSLAVGAITESVNVVASSAQVQADSAQVGRVIESKQISDLTLNGRNPLYLPLLKAGVVGPSIATFDPDGLGNGNFAINGSRPDENGITIDGAIALRTRANGAIIGTLNVDTVQEVQVLTANYNAEYGRTSGGQLRYITKSGGQDFHGGLWEYFKNNVLNANTWARNRSGDPTQAKPVPYRFNEFGYAIGGPVYIPKVFNKDRNKLFFFWSEEWVRWHQYSTSTGTVPSPAMRKGDFSDLLSPTNTFFGRVRAINDPLTGKAFPNNVIPPDRLSPNGIALLNAYPVPTPSPNVIGATNWQGAGPDPRHTRKDTVKVDYHLTEKNTLSVRGTIFEFDEVQPFRGTFDRVQVHTNRPNRTSIASLTSTLSPTLVNEASFSANVDRNILVVAENGRYQRGQYGINYPYLFPGTKDVPDKIPTITIANFSTVDGGPYPAFSSGPIFTWSDTLTKVHGNHTFKFGVFIERSGENDFDQVPSGSTAGSTNNPNGLFVFADTGTAVTSGVAIANAALGLFNTYGEVGRKDYTPYRATGVDLFVQDGWKVTRRLKLEYGVRWEYWPPWSSLWGNIATFNPQYFDASKAAVVDRKTGAVVSGPLYNGMVLPGNGFPKSALGRVDAASDPSIQNLFHNLPDGLTQTHKNVFDPRVGFAYSVNDKTVIRAGGGEFHDRLVLNDNTLLGSNAPLQFQQVVSNGSVDAPGGVSAAAQRFPLLVSMLDPVFKHPTAWNWNLTVQRQLPWSTTIEVAYVGRSAYHLTRLRNINSLTPGTVQANPGVNPDSLRPYQGYVQIQLAENAAQSNYHGLQVQLDRRFHSGLGFGVAYTWSKTLDNADTKSEVLFNPFDPRGSRGPASTDRPQVLVLNYVYAIPFLKQNKGILGKTVGGWEVSGVSQFQSGAPLSPLGSTDQAGVGPGNGTQPWNLVSDPRVRQPAFSFSNSDQNFWFKPSAFALPAPGTFGNSGRGVIRGPDSQIWNIGLRKNFAVRENMKFQLRGEAFNFLNHPNWSNPVTTTTSASFGRVQSKTGSREVQLALRFDF